MDAARAINEMIFAMLFIAAAGLGPMAGTLALFVHTTGTLSKLFSEAVEAIDPRPVEGIRATGATVFEDIVYGVIPRPAPLDFLFPIPIRGQCPLCKRCGDGGRRRYRHASLGCDQGIPIWFNGCHAHRHRGHCQPGGPGQFLFEKAMHLGAYRPGDRAISGRLTAPPCLGYSTCHAND